MKVTMFHLMPYPRLSDEVIAAEPSYWVTMPNKHYDPKVGHETYNRYLDQLELCDELGFELPEPGHYAVGVLFMPRDAEWRGFIRATFEQMIEREGMTLIPLKMYFNERGRIKLQLGLAKGKKLHDKRDTEKKRDWEREKGRLLRARG